MSGSGISWLICKSAPRSRQIATPAPHHSVFTGRMPFLPPNQQRQSTEAKTTTQTHTHTFNGPFSGTIQVSRYQKGKTNLDFTEARDSGISWAICKSAPRSRQIATPAAHHSVFTGRMPFLPPNQQRQSTEAKTTTQNKHKKKLKSGLVAFYDIRPGNRAGLFSKEKMVKLRVEISKKKVKKKGQVGKHTI